MTRAGASRVGVSRRGRALLVGLLGAGAAAATGLGSCGIPTDAKLHVIRPEDVPYGLNEAPTTTAGFVELPPGNLDDSLSVEQVTLYFVADGRLVPVLRQLSRPIDGLRVLRELAEGPRTGDQPGAGARIGDQPKAVRTVIRETQVGAVSQRAGVASVELADPFGELPPTEQLLAVAQLSLTLTARPGIGQVSFLLNRQPVNIPRADGSLSRGPVSRDDYSGLIG